MKATLIFPFFIFTFIFSFNEKVKAQTAEWTWAKSIGATSNDWGSSLAVDESGNMYITGEFEGAVDFDPGTGSLLLGTSGTRSSFISKWDSSGNIIWAKALTGGSYTRSESDAIAIDASGNVYTTGTFFGLVDFDPGAGGQVFNLSTTGFDFVDGTIDWDIFISKLDRNGNFVWAKSFGDTDSLSQFATDISIDRTGNFLITGSFVGIVDFDAGPSIFNLTSAGRSDIFIAKYDSSGGLIWAKAIIGADAETGTTIEIDALDNIYLGVNYYSPSFQVGTETIINFNNHGVYLDFFICKMNSSGDFIWAKSFGGSEHDFLSSFLIDASENICLTGTFSRAVDFDPGPEVFNLFSAGKYDIFIFKLDNDGNFLWSKGIGGTNDGYGHSIALDSFNKIYLTGIFTGNCYFDLGAKSSSLTSMGGFDAFILKADGSGNFEWVRQMGGYNNDYTVSVVTQSPGKIYLTGSFQSPSIISGSSTLTNADSSGNTSDIFIARMTDVPRSIDSLQVGSLSVFPNPVSQILTILLTNIHKKAELFFFNITGQLMYQLQTIDKQKIEIDIQNFANGIYFVKIQTPDFVETRKVIIAK